MRIDPATGSHCVEPGEGSATSRQFRLPQDALRQVDGGPGTKVVGLGSLGMDYMAAVAAFPKPDEKLRTENLEVGALPPASVLSHNR